MRRGRAEGGGRRVAWTGTATRRALAFVLLVAIAGSSAAEPALVVNGLAVDRNTTTLIRGSSYAPGAALAQALGAGFFTDPQRTTATLTLGGRTLQVPIAASPAEVGDGGLDLDGVAVPGSSAVLSGPEVFLPVKPVVEAFGGRVAYLQASDSVVAVLPRARLGSMRLQSSATQERLVVRISAPIRYTAYFNEPVNQLELHLERTDLAAAVTAVEGDRFVRATPVASGGSVDLRIQLAEGVRYEVYELPDGKGFDLVVAFHEGPAGTPAGPPPRVVLDPGHGGEDPGLVFPGAGTEASLTLAFAERLATALAARGLDVSLSRTGDFAVPASKRSQDGVASDLFVSIHAADLPAGQFHVYYLADADDVAELDMAIRTNAAAAVGDPETDRLRRQVLLNLVPDLDLGRRYAEGLGARLFEAGSYRASDTAGAPLYVLGGAAGRGVLMEFGPADLASAALVEALADAITSLLANVGQP